jgi:hypothetical protein
MKSLLFIVTTIGMSFLSFSQDVKAEKQIKTKAPVTFKTTEIERNGIDFGADETFTFEFKNTSKSPIIVTNVGTSCGCTTAKKPEAPIAPGKTGVISVKYDTKRVGNFTKEITVTTNAQNEPYKLTIKGSVNPEGKTN